MNSSPTQQQTLQNLYNSIPQSIIANFQTHLSQYKLSDNIQIDISTQLDEDALNKIIKQMLENTIDQQSIDKVNFDFLVNDKLLRGKLKSHLVRYEISCEQVINIQYFIAFREFQAMKQSPVQDWISSICQVIGLQNNIGVMAALFNGNIEYHQKYTKKQAKIKLNIHQAPIKSIKTLPSQQQNIYYCITGGIDQQLKISKFTIQTIPQIISINSHDGTILAIDINNNLDGLICTAGGKGALNIWRISQNFLQDDNVQVKTQKKKKRKTNKKNLPHLAQQIIHKDCINSINWLNGSIVATGSSDHSIKFTDIQKMKQTRTYLTKDSITTSIDYSNNTLFTSHEDGFLRTWDLRNHTTNPLQTYKSHTKYSSCLKVHTHSNIFASGSYDQTVKIWDTRSVFPLQTIPTNYEKVFALCWKNQKQLISGGASPFVTFHSI